MDVLSPQNLLSCARRGQQGCSGGHVERAWNYLRKIGYLLVLMLKRTKNTFKLDFIFVYHQLKFMWLEIQIWNYKNCSLRPTEFKDYLNIIISRVVNEECYPYESGYSNKVGNCKVSKRAPLDGLHCGQHNEVNDIKINLNFEYH